MEVQNSNGVLDLLIDRKEIIGHYEEFNIRGTAAVLEA